MRRWVTVGAAAMLSTALALIVGFLAVLVLLDVDRTRVGAGPGPMPLRFGAPIAWVTQDQSGYGPFRPRAVVGFASPTENPTRVSVSALLGDVVIVAGTVTAAAAAGVIVVARIAGRRRAVRSW